MASIDIDLDDILWGLAGYEKQQLVDDLYDDGYCPKQIGNHPDDEDDDEWDTNVRKLLGNKWRLTKEDEETILQITKKIVE